MSQCLNKSATNFGSAHKQSKNAGITLLVVSKSSKFSFKINFFPSILFLL